MKQPWVTGHMQLSDVKLGCAEVKSARPSHGPVQVVAVTGGKGGTGKTNIAVNLAQALANEGVHTLLLDADLGMANVDVLLGLDVKFTLFDVFSGACELEDIILTGTDNLMVIPAASGVKQLANMDQQECAGLVRAFGDLSHPIDTLIIDTATGISESVASFCRAATEILVVVCNEPASIRDSVSQVKMFSSEYGLRRFRILANMVQSASEAENLFKIMDARLAGDDRLQISCAGFVPVDESLRTAVSHHQAVVNLYPRSRSAMALKNLARHVMAWPQPQSPRGHVEFFVERLIDNENAESEAMS
jgi:flagellar biosynthesis protein FlhG